MSLFDSGLQPERTDLAWRRTSLALAIGAMITFRLLPEAMGPWALSLGVLACLVAAAAWILSRRRGRDWQRHLLAAGNAPGGALILCLALTGTAAALVTLVYVVVQHG